MSQQLIELLSDITYARAAFFRRHSVIPYHLMRTFLANEDRMLTLLTQFSVPAPLPAPRARAPLPPLAHNFDIPLNLVQLLFGRDATVGLGQGQGQNQFWDAVTVGLSTEQFAAATRVYENPPDVAEQDQCCICQEGITTEAAIHTLCPGPALGDGVTSTNHHALHRRCAQSWFAISTRCPVCRADLRTLAPTTTNAAAGAPGSEPSSSGGVHPDVQS
jgi:hypothetical protein